MIFSPPQFLARRSPEFDEAEIEAALEPVLKEILGQAPGNGTTHRDEGDKVVGSGS